MSKNILEAVGSYLSQNRNTKLKVIDVVIFQDGMVDNFVQSMKSAVNEKGKQRGVWAKVSDWISTGLNYMLGGNFLSDIIVFSHQCIVAGMANRYSANNGARLIAAKDGKKVSWSGI